MKSVKRIVDTDFWNDEKVLDYTPEEKYFFQFLLTNPNTRQSGIYKLPIKMATFWTGYNRDTIERLLYRFQTELKLIIYSSETQEVAILNYLKHAIVKGGKPVNDCIKRDLSTIKDKNLIIAVNKHMKEFFDKSEKESMKQIGDIFNEVVSKEDVNLFNVDMKDFEEKKESVVPYDLILDYLNSKQPDKRPYGKTNENKKYIRARWNEDNLSDSSPEDKLVYFYTAIDNSFVYWTQHDGLENLKPSTIFNGKMEGRVTGDAYSWNKDQVRDNQNPEWVNEYKQARRIKEAKDYDEAAEKVRNMSDEEYAEIQKKFFDL